MYRSHFRLQIKSRDNQLGAGRGRGRRQEPCARTALSRRVPKPWFCLRSKASFPLKWHQFPSHPWVSLQPICAGGIYGFPPLRGSTFEKKAKAGVMRFPTKSVQLPAPAFLIPDSAPPRRQSSSVFAQHIWSCQPPS